MDGRAFDGFVIAAAVATTIGNANAQELNLPQVVDRNADAIIYLEVSGELRGGGTAQWSGTGFVVHPNGFAITNSHVAGDASQFKNLRILAHLKNKSSKEIPVEVVTRLKQRGYRAGP